MLNMYKKTDIKASCLILFSGLPPPYFLKKSVYMSQTTFFSLSINKTGNFNIQFFKNYE